MPAPQLVARASGVAVYQQGAELLVVDLGTAWAYTLGFVLGIIALVGGAGCVIVMSLGSLTVGAFMLLGPIAALLLLWGLVTHVRKRHAIAPDGLPVRLIVDHGSGQVLDGERRPLTSVSQASLRLRHQLGSSSRRLELVHGQGTLEVVAGNPFAGGCHPIAEALAAQGLPLR